ncbi:MAG: hypothetical protein JRN15_07050, partial [Nitrososphaerota archaeon]|nr:hypothetical protein [Nitrososphaerota archaeon]
MNTAISGSVSISLRGMPIELDLYEGAGTLTNKYFQSFNIPEFEKLYLPDCVKPFTDANPIG